MRRPYTFALGLAGTLACVSIGTLMAWNVRAASPNPDARQPATQPSTVAAERPKNVYEGLVRLENVGGVRFDSAFIDRKATWSRRWAQAAKEQSGRQEDRVAAVEGHLERMRATGRGVRMRVERTGDADPLLVPTIEYYVADAEAWVAEVGRAATD